MGRTPSLPGRAKHAPGAMAWSSVAFSSPRITSHATSFSKGVLDVCRLLSSSHTSSPMMSGRCESVCPSFTATGPSSAIVSRSRTPKVCSSGGRPASRSFRRLSVR